MELEKLGNKTEKKYKAILIRGEVQNVATKGMARK